MASAGGLFGPSQNVDTGDTTAVDFDSGQRPIKALWRPGGCTPMGPTRHLNGGHVLSRHGAHEAGHNYGLAHSDGLPLAPGEDPLVHHVMASGDHYSVKSRWLSTSL